MTDLFISYRRGLDRHAAGRLYGELASTFGKRRIFMDVDDIPAGVDFKRRLEESVTRCRVLLAVISADWASVRDDRGQLRLFQPDDFVRIEIASALDIGIRVVPVLLDGADMPLEQDLPPQLHGLLRFQAVWLRHDRFSSDVLDLAKGIKGQIGIWPRVQKWIAQTFVSSGYLPSRGIQPILVASPNSVGGVSPSKPTFAARQNANRRLQTDIERFVGEEIVNVDGARLSATSLYEAYVTWCEMLGKEPLSLPTFGRALAEHGFLKVIRCDGVHYNGVGFRKQQWSLFKPEKSAPDAHVQRFVCDVVVRSDGSFLSASAFYESYCVWCERHGIEPLALPTFGRAIAEYQIPKLKTAHGVRYAGVALRDAD